MKIYLTDQSKHFARHLQYLKKQDIIPYYPQYLTEKTSSLFIPTNRTLTDLTASFFGYKIFPPHIMTYLTEWAHEGREMRIGDTIVQQVFIPPFPALSQKIIFGVRINAIIKEPGRIGFSYETLQGHVEIGVSTFILEQAENGIIFRIHTFSRPGNLLTRLLGPVFSVPYQAYCTKQALMYVKGLSSKFYL